MVGWSPMEFEVDQSCRGAHWGRKKDEQRDGAMYPGDSMVIDVADLDKLLAYVEEYGSIRILPPRDGRLPRRFRIEIRG